MSSSRREVDHRRRDRKTIYDFSDEERPNDKRRSRGTEESRSQRNRHSGRFQSRSSSRERKPIKRLAEETKPVEKEKPCFIPSGILAEYQNKLNGVTLKFTEPIDAVPPTETFALY